MTQQEIIITKAIELYSRYGIKLMTMEDIATACGISKKTLYGNFENKYALIEVVVAQMTAELMTGYGQLSRSSDNAIAEVVYSLQHLEKLFRSMNYRMLDDIEKYYHEIWRKVDSFKHEAGVDFIENNINRGRAEGLYKDTFHVGIISTMRLHQLEMIHKHTAAQALQQTLHQITTHYITGIATNKGLEELKKYQATQ